MQWDGGICLLDTGRGAPRSGGTFRANAQGLPAIFRLGYGKVLNRQAGIRASEPIAACQPAIST